MSIYQNTVSIFTGLLYDCLYKTYLPVQGYYFMHIIATCCISMAA